MRKELIDTLSVLTVEELEYLDKKEVEIDVYTNRHSLKIEKKELLNQGKLIQVRPHTRFVHFPKHTHDFIEMTYVVRGSVTHIFNGTKVTLEEGDVALINQNIVQEILPAGKDDLAVDFVILPELFDSALQFMDNDKNLLYQFILSAMKNDGQKAKYLHFKGKGVVSVENLLENIIWSIYNKKGSNRGIKQLSMGLLFMNMSLNSEYFVLGGYDENTKLKIRVLKHIEEEYQTAELSTLATELNYDISWLSTQVKRLTGRTFKELLQEKRLNQAEYLLRTTNLSIGDIIDSVGYSNSSYFYRIFRGRFGVSPKDFRKTIVEDRMSV